MQDKLEMSPDAVGRVCEMMLELKQHPLDETTYKMLVMFVVGPHEECPREFVDRPSKSHKSCADPHLTPKHRPSRRHQAAPRVR